MWRARWWCCCCCWCGKSEEGNDGGRKKGAKRHGGAYEWTENWAGTVEGEMRGLPYMGSPPQWAKGAEGAVAALVLVAGEKNVEGVGGRENGAERHGWEA